MALHILGTRRLVAELAAGTVSGREQACYLALAAIVWLIPYYFYIDPGSGSVNVAWTLSMNYAEGAMVAIVNFAGAFHCLRRCEIDPERHFLKDFVCLYLPCSVLSIAVTWGTFHALFWPVVTWPEYIPDSLLLPRPTTDALVFRVFDVLRYLVIVGQVFLVYALVGRAMGQVSDLREGPCA